VLALYNSPLGTKPKIQRSSKGITLKKEADVVSEEDVVRKKEADVVKAETSRGVLRFFGCF
jgi:hypothetical protein